MVRAELSKDHLARLSWFEQHTGQTVEWPEPLEGGLFLSGKAKGIFKPKDVPYAVSIKIMLDSNYRDDPITRRDDGSFYFAYNQEEHRNGRSPESISANIALARCIEDQVPVGILRQVDPIGGKARYVVEGLATPHSWQNGQFSFDSAGTPDIGALRDTALVLRAHQEVTEIAEAVMVADDYDARLKVIKEILVRQGQPGFRAQLLRAYNGTCAISGCDFEPVLEAAHLKPYRGPDTNHVSNGLLLRADLHTLLDTRWLAISPDDHTVHISRKLSGSEYEAFDGQRLHLPAQRQALPAPANLTYGWDAFQHAEIQRALRA